MSTMPYSTPRQVFETQYEFVRRDEVVGVLLAFFLGCFGIHHFYLNRVGLGILYCCFSWTGIPAVLGVIECFFMPGRVRSYNAAQATGLAAALGINLSGYPGYSSYSSYSGWAGSDWVGSGFHYPQPVTAFAQNDSSTEITTLAACGICHKANPTGARFCNSCGSRFG